MIFTSADLGGLDVKLGHRVIRYLCTKAVPMLYPNRPARVLLANFRDEIGVSFSKIEPALVQAGLIVKLADQNRREFGMSLHPRCYSPYYDLTEKAWGIAKGNTLKRMSRRQLEQLLARAQERVRQVQQDDRFLYEFGFLAIIGSYMEEKTDYGDLDLVYWVHLKKKFRSLTDRERCRLHYTSWPADQRIWILRPKFVLSARPRRYVNAASHQRIDMITFDDFAVLRHRVQDMPFRVLIGDVRETIREWREADRNGELALIDGGMRESEE